MKTQYAYAVVKKKSNEFMGTIDILRSVVYAIFTDKAHALAWISALTVTKKQVKVIKIKISY